MPLGRVITELLTDVRGRVEVRGHGDTWQVTAGSFEAALGYVDVRFGDAVVLARRDRGRRRPRVTLEVSTDPALAAAAPPLSELARPVPEVPVDPVPEHPARESGLPAALETIFASQNPGHATSTQSPSSTS